ncbi:cytochrome B562 [Pasteurellaceae bacterium Macca]|nr:cytochrome B562 [Pasteurellaceae bacterium Macca]
MKKLVVLLAGLVCGVAMANVSMEMFQMKTQSNALLTAKSPAEFSQAAEAFLDVANKAKNTLPRSLKNDESKFPGYQQGIQEVMDVVTQADNLAKQGNLDEAKSLIEKLDSLKQHYHREYK